MGQLSDDGQWWWDGTNWIATARLVLPNLPITAFEQSGKLVEAAARARILGRLDGWRVSVAIGVPALLMTTRVVGDLRSWRLEQLALATTYLLGPDEPMLAGEPATLAMFPEDYSTGNLAVAVTKAHVVVFRIDVGAPGQGQPRWVVIARRAADVKIEFQKRLIGMVPELTITDGNGRWTIRGFPGSIKPEPVLQAWRQSASTGART